MSDRQRTVSFTVLFIVVFLDMLGLGIIIPLLPAYATGLGATGLWVGIIFAGHSLTRLVVLPLIGRSSDRRGRKKAFVTVGIFLYVLLALGYVAATSVYALALIRLIQGVASAMIFPIAMAYVGEMSPKDREGRYMGTFNVGLFVGMGCGPVLGGVLKDMFGMASVFYAMALLSAVSLVLVVFLLPEQKTRSRRKIGDVISYSALIRKRPVQGILIYRIVNALIRGGTMSFLPLYAAGIGASASEIGLLLSTNTILVGVLQRPFGRLADRYSKLFLILCGSMLASLTLFLVPCTTHYPVLFLIATVMGLGSAMSMPAATAVAVRIGKKGAIGSTMGLFTMAMSVGMIVAPMIAGGVMDYRGIAAAFYCMGILCTLGTVMIYLPIRAYRNGKQAS